MINKADTSTAKIILIIVIKSLVFLFTSKQKKPSGRPTPALITKSIIVRIGRTGLDADNDCQNTQQELLIAASNTPVQFKSNKRCTVTYGQWRGVYTGKTFTKASDLDIDHIVPLAHAHRHGADKWTRKQRRAFANDFDNLLVVDDIANQSKSDQAPHEWLPPNKDYWCDYGKRWQRVKDKYGLLYSDQERIALNRLAETCF